MSPANTIPCFRQEALENFPKIEGKLFKSSEMSAFEAKPFQTRRNMVTFCSPSNDLRQLSFFFGEACFKAFLRRHCVDNSVQGVLTMTAFTGV